MNFDIRTLVFVLGITRIIQVVVFIHQYRINKTIPGVGWWLMWSAVGVIAFSFLLLRGITSIDTMAMIAQNFLLFLGVIFLYIGLMRFLDKKENRWIVISIIALFIVPFLYFIWVDNNIQVRGILIAAALAAVSFLSAQGLFVNKTRDITASANFTAAVFMVHGCYFTFRAVMMLAGTPIDKFDVPTLFNVAGYMDAIIVGLLWTFGLIIMINQRLNAGISDAKTDVELIFNTSPDASLIARFNDGIIVNINEEFSTATGFTRDETVGKSIADIPIWKNPADRQRVVDELGEKGFCENFEALFQRKDLSQIVGMISAKIITLKGIPHMISTTRDITHRKQAEEALRERYKELNCLFGVSALLELPGISLDEILRRTVMLIPPALQFPEITEARILMEGQIFQTARFRETSWMLAREIMVNGKPAGKVEVGYLEERKANHEGPFLIEERYLINAIAERLGRVVDRMRAEAALRESEARYRAVTQSASNAIITADSTGTILSWNRGAEKIFGYTEAEISGQSLNRLMPQRYRQQHLAGMKRVQAGGEPHLIGKTVELEGLRKDMSEFPIELSLAQWETAEGRFYTAILRDITERKRLQENLEYFAVHDTLTGLLNRRSLEGMLNRTIARAKRGAISSLLYMDLDNFKEVNDNVGHSVGDEVLITLSGLLKAELRTEDTVFRLGGDEFAVLLEGMDSREALTAAERLRLVVERHPFELGGRVFPLSLSIGLIEIEGTLTTGELLSQADAAMYRAKAQGKNRVVVYSSEPT